MPEAVIFDVGETLLDESRAWEDIAEACGVPLLTLMGVLGGVIARGQPHREVFTVLGVEMPDFERPFTHDDLYPDALPALRRVGAAGYRVGVAGNQSPQRQAELEAIFGGVDLVISSGALGVEKPDPTFFLQLAELIGVPADRCTYVGDRVDNDVKPALAAGMTAAFILRGPWAYLQREGLPQQAIVIRSLDELPSRLGAL